MSTILKALRRLEEEKAAAEEPRPLREQIASTPLAVERPRRRGWLGAAAALVLGVAAGGGVIWSLFSGSAESVQVAAAAPEPAPALRPATAVARVPVPAPESARAAGPPEHAFESDVEIVERPDALPRLADDEPITSAQTAPAPGSTRPVESSAAMERARQAALEELAAAERARQGLPPEVAAPAPATVQPAAPPATVAPPTPEPEPAKIVAVAPEILAPAPAPAAPKPTPKPAPELKPAPPPEPDPKPVREAAAPRPASEAVREAPEPPADLPPFAIEKTQWHPLADRRVAWLRMPGESEPRRVVEGDVVDGLLVAKIEPSGVVFERDGKKIQRVLGKR